MKSNSVRYEIPCVILFLAIVALIFSRPVLQSGDSLGTSDWDQLLCLHEVAAQTVIEHQQFPLWNPYACGGITLIGNPQARSFSPALLFSLLFGAIYGLKIEIFVHLFVGLIGMYFLMRELGVRGIAALIPGILFMLNSKYALHLAEGHTFWLAIVYLPLVVMFYLKGLRDKKYIFAAALFLALMVFEGGTYIVVKTALFLAIYALLCSLQQRRLVPLISFFMLLFLTVLFSAPKLLPNLQLMFQYPRFIDCNDFIPFRYLDEIFLQRDHVLNGRLFLNKYYWHEYGAYLGIVPLVLFVLSMIFLSRKRWPWLVMGGFFIFLAVGNFAYYSPWNLLQKVPIFNCMRVPSRYLILFIFAFAVLVGFLLQRFQNWGKIPGVIKYVLLFSLLGFLTYDLTDVNSAIFQEAFPIKNTFQEEKIIFSQQKEGELYGAYSGMYPLISKNAGVVDAYEPMPVPRNALNAADNNYQGEYFLLKGKGTIKQASWSPGKIVFNLNLQGNDTLIINQNYDVGWRTNSSNSAVSTYGLLSTAVAVTDKEVVFYYMPASFLIGLLLMFIGVLLFVFRRRIKFLN